MKNNEKLKRMSQADILYAYYKSLEPSKKQCPMNSSLAKLKNSHRRITEQGEVLKAILKYQLKKN